MAATDGKTTTDLIEKISRQPYAFDFFRAVRLMQCHLRGKDAARPAPRLGTSKLPQDDPVRFGQKPSLAFAPSTLDSFVWPGDDPARFGTLKRDQLADNPAVPNLPKLYVNFFGLFGPNGPMPLHFTDYAICRQLGQSGDGEPDDAKPASQQKDAQGRPVDAGTRKDFSLAAFCDIFHHRLVSLFFRAWAVNQKAVDLDRPGESRFGAFIGSFIGFGQKSLQQRDALGDWAKLYYSGRLSSQPRNAEGLQAILEDYFGVPVEIQTFKGRWISVPEEYRCELGSSLSTNCLGKTVIVGDHVYDCQMSFRIRFGPMSFADVRRLLPEGESCPRLKAWVLNYVGDEYLWDVQLALRADEVPSSCLGGVPTGGSGARAQLGRTCWLKSSPADHTIDDIIFSPN